MTTKKITIAIDGFSSCGKSTVAKQLAKQLGYTYIDTGAMYRSVALLCLRNKWIADEQIMEEPLQEAMQTLNIHFTYDASEEKYLTWLNGELVEEAIRRIEVANIVSPVSKLGFVREAMVAQQRKMGEAGGVILDGRDIGTVVFPHAELKIFMTASVEVRAQRRYDELQAKGENISLQEVAKNIASRDEMDQNRAIAPLKKADDAVELDNSNLSHQEQFNFLLELVQERLA